MWRLFREWVLNFPRWDWSDWLMATCMTVLAGVLLLLLLVVVDACTLRTVDVREAVVRGKDHSAKAWVPITTVISSGSGTSTIVTMTYIPPSWSVLVDDGAGNTVRAHMPEAAWNDTRDGETVTVTTKVGWTGTIKDRTAVRHP